jgi:P27 family predicted phage terminase small subunit
MRRGRQSVKQGEIKIQHGRPEPPKDLDQYGVDAWDSLCDDLEQQGNLCTTDRKLIECYAKTYAILKRTEEQLAVEDLTITASNGRAFINPLVNVHQSCIARIQRLLSDLRLSPVTRSKALSKSEDSEGFEDVVE